MMTELENGDDLQAWFDTPEEDIIASNDLASHAAESLERLAERLGEKTTLFCTTQLINESIKNGADWKVRHGGQVALGMISEVCEKSFKKNLDEIVKMVCPGMVDEHPRVRYQAMMALGLTMNCQSPAL